jgi:peptidoglycan/xylan/chitin deacetylase (PgdA/CDA1 family)
MTDPGPAEELTVQDPVTDDRRERQDALAATYRRRRLTALAGLLALIAIVLLIVNRPAPAGTPAASHAANEPAARTAKAARMARDDSAVDDVLAYTSYITRGTLRHKEVALTFDDGPGPTTAALVHYLVSNGVPATFFLVGKAIDERPGIVGTEYRAGFSLGTHTQSHARLGSKSAEDQSREILSAADRITRITGHAVKLFRPPYGSFDERTLAILHAERMLMVLWSVDTKDYEAHSSKPVVYTALSGARAGSVVLMHDGPGARPRTLAAVRKIVPALRRSGYRLVSLPVLLRDDPPPHHQPEPRSLAG